MLMFFTIPENLENAAMNSRSGAKAGWAFLHFIEY